MDLHVDELEELQEQGSDDDDDIKKLEPLELSRRLTPWSRSAVVTTADGVIFCQVRSSFKRNAAMC